MQVQLQLLVLSLRPFQFRQLLLLIGVLYLFPPFFEQLLATRWVVMHLLLEEFHDLICVNGVKSNEYVLFAEVPVCLKEIRVLLLDVAVQSNVAEVLIEAKALVPLCLFVFTL